MTPLPGNEGNHTGVRCPRCGGEVIYNGNYFCEYWVYRGRPPRPLDNGECDWVLSHDEEHGDPIGRVDRRVWRELRDTYRPLREYLDRHPEEDRP